MKRPTAKQLAARRRFTAMVKSGKFSRRSRRRRVKVISRRRKGARREAAPLRSRAHRRRASPRRVRATRRPADAGAGPTVRVSKMGIVLAIDYHHAGQRREYRHVFKRRPTLYRTTNGTYLVIGPVHAGRWIKDSHR